MNRNHRSQERERNSWESKRHRTQCMYCTIFSHVGVAGAVENEAMIEESEGNALFCSVLFFFSCSHRQIGSKTDILDKFKFSIQYTSKILLAVCWARTNHYGVLHSDRMHTYLVWERVNKRTNEWTSKQAKSRPNWFWIVYISRFCGTHFDVDLKRFVWRVKKRAALCSHSHRHFATFSAGVTTKPASSNNNHEDW